MITLRLSRTCADVNYKLEYIKGETNIYADALSRYGFLLLERCRRMACWQQLRRCWRRLGILTVTT